MGGVPAAAIGRVTMLTLRTLYFEELSVGMTDFGPTHSRAQDCKSP
jgi:hypothetical protein